MPESFSDLPTRPLNRTAVREAPEVFAVPAFDQIASLDGSHQRWSMEAIGALSTSLHLPALRWLNLSDTGLRIRRSRAWPLLPD